MLEVVAYYVCDGCGDRLEGDRGPNMSSSDPGRERARRAGWSTRIKLAGRRDYCPDCRARWQRARSRPAEHPPVLLAVWSRDNLADVDQRRTT